MLSESGPAATPPPRLSECHRLGKLQRYSGNRQRIALFQRGQACQLDAKGSPTPILEFWGRTPRTPRLESTSGRKQEE